MSRYHASIVGIVNITEDSFSDGGRYLDAEAAIGHAHTLRDEGAAIVELGPESSHPDAVAVDGAEQIRRLAPVLDALLGEGMAVSVDTSDIATQRYCLARHVAMLNDVRGFPDPQIYGELAGARCDLVVMHSIQRAARASRVAADPQAVYAGMFEFFCARIAALCEAGIARSRLILDPGMGLWLGRNPEPSLRVLAGLEELRERFGLRTLVSVSRKSFLRELIGRDLAQRGAATLAAEVWAAGQGVEYIRTHDVGALHDALRVLRAIEQEKAAP